MIRIIWVILAFFLRTESEEIFPKLHRKTAEILSGIRTNIHTVLAVMADRVSEFNIETIREIVEVNSFPLVTYALLLCILVRIARENRVNKILEKEICNIRNIKDRGVADMAALQDKFIPMITGLQKQVFLLEEEKKGLTQNMEFSQAEMLKLKAYIDGMPAFDRTAIDELRQEVTLLKKENESLVEKFEDTRAELVTMTTKRAATLETDTKKLEEMRQEYHDLFYNHREYCTISLSCLERDFYNFVHWTNHKIGWLSYNNDYMTQQLNNTDYMKQHLNNMDNYRCSTGSCMSTKTTEQTLNAEGKLDTTKVSESENRYVQV